MLQSIASADTRDEHLASQVARLHERGPFTVEQTRRERTRLRCTVTDVSARDGGLCPVDSM